MAGDARRLCLGLADRSSRSGGLAFIDDAVVVSEVEEGTAGLAGGPAAAGC